MSDTELIPAIPAATLVIFHDRAGAPPELLMVERAKAMAFAAGALVFPGGRIDPGDHALAAILAPDKDGDDVAARIAAIRETIEEAGVAVGLTPPPDAPTLAAIRRLGSAVALSLMTTWTIWPGSSFFRPSSIATTSQWGGKMLETRTRL